MSIPGAPRIGTPHRAHATRVMLLGAGELGKEVVIALQRLGVEVIAVDRYPAAPAQQVAHGAFTIDMSDEDTLYGLIEHVRPDFVVPEIEAIATAALVRAEDAGLTHVIPNARATELTMDREGIRELASRELGLPTSRYMFASSPEQLEEATARVGFPCVVKPVMSSSGKGQSVVRTAADVAAAWDAAQAGGRVDRGRVIVEEFIPFDYEITLLTVRGIDPETGQSITSFCEPIGHVQQNGDYVESWQPAAMSALALDNAKSVAARITSALGGRGVFGVELFVVGDDVFFSEVSPRPHDTGMVTMLGQRFSEFELHARAILGLPIDTTLTTPAASAVVYGGIDTDDPVIEGLEQALSVPETDVRWFGKPEAFARRRVGVVLASAEDVVTARSRAQIAASRLRVVDGRSL